MPMPSRNGYENGVVCANGHWINRFGSRPERTTNACPQCGAKAIQRCATCQTPVRGAPVSQPAPGMTVASLQRPAPPDRCCDNCGSPYEWTDRAIAAARDLIALETNVSDKERAALTAELPNLFSQGPRTAVAMRRLRAFLGTAAPATVQALGELLIDIVAETVKRSLWP